MIKNLFVVRSDNPIRTNNLVTILITIKGIAVQDLGCITKNYSPRAYTALEVLNELDVHPNSKIADLGCGDGRMHDRIKAKLPFIEYVGIDINYSEEVKSRKRSDMNFVTFDGINIPFEENYFDIVFSHQVFEHVRYQEDLLQDVLRVIKDDGWFIGSLSGIEPFHSNSIFNLTPYGWLRILNENGFKVCTMRPGVDCTSLISRQFKQKTGKVPSTITGNIFDDIKSMSISDIDKSRLMLHFSGHIVFLAKPQK